MANRGPGRWQREGRRAELEELWRAGGLRPGRDLALPVDVAASRRGRVAVTDVRLAEVTVLEPDGSWLGPWTRRGAGPGEVLRPVAATWTEDGRLVVFDVAGAKVVWLDGPGEVNREADVEPGFTAPVVASGSLAKAAVAPDGTVYLQPSPRPLPGEARAVDVLLRYRPEEGVRDTVVADTVPTLAASGRLAPVVTPGVPRIAFAPGPGEHLVTGDPNGSYRLAERGPDLRRLRSLCRAVGPRPLTARERGEGDVPGGRRELAAAIRRAERPSRPAAFGSFFVGARGRIWVQRDRRDPFDPAAFLGAPGGRFDVFSSEGRFLGGVTAPADVRLRAARGDTVWGVAFGELDEARIVAYRLALRDRAPRGEPTSR